LIQLQLDELVPLCKGIIMKKNFDIEILRVVFMFFIVSYHFYSYCLSLLDIPSLAFFKHGYIADEFFFMVSGFFFAQYLFENTSHTSIAQYIKRRICAIAFPYYFSWVITFILIHIITNNVYTIDEVVIHLCKSIYELTFIEMAGFNPCFLTSSVSWFFSSLLISLVMMYPIIRCSNKSIVEVISCLLTIFLYSFLYSNYDVLNAPHTIVAAGFIYKGIFRALAGVNAGILSYFFIKTYKHTTSRKYSQVLNLIEIILFTIIIVYSILPMEISLDYEITFAIFLLFIITLCNPHTYPLKICKIINSSARLTRYIFCTQVIVYALVKPIFKLQTETSHTQNG